MDLGSRGEDKGNFQTAKRRALEKAMIIFFSL